MKLAWLQHRRVMVELTGQVDTESLVEVVVLSQGHNHLLEHLQETSCGSRIKRHGHPGGINKEADEPHHLADLCLVGSDRHAESFDRLDQELKRGQGTVVGGCSQTEIVHHCTYIDAKAPETST